MLKYIFLYTDEDEEAHDESKSSKPAFGSDCLVDDFEVSEAEVPFENESVEEKDDEQGEEEEIVEIDEKEEEDDNPANQKLTAKGTKRVRNTRWTNEEHYALFCSLFKLEHKIRATGPGTSQGKHDAWDSVIGKHLHIIIPIY